jgi:Uma2 family endonuclease
MIAAPAKLLTLDEYLVYQPDNDVRYELVNGELVEMPTESFKNLNIAKFLLYELAKYVPLMLLAYNTEIEVAGFRTTSRIPDLVLHSEESVAALIQNPRNLITGNMPAPALVIEVVSPGQENRDRDYRFKHTEYAARGIAEYWIIDSELQQVTICLWVNGQYEDTIYTNDSVLVSTIVPNFNLSANQILAFGQL